MSVEDLQADIDRNIVDLDARALSSVDDVKAYIKDTLLALFKSVANEVEEIDDDLSDLVEHADSILQPDDAAIFALVIKDVIEISQALQKRLKPGRENDNKWAKRLTLVFGRVQAASARLMEITVQPDDSEGEDDPEDLADAAIVPNEAK